MKASRNDPCPCGSGKKYKACHLRADMAAARVEEALGPEALALSRAATFQSAREADFWEADVAPLVERFRETGEAGSLVMVVAGGLILTGEVLARRPAGAQARAGAVLEGVMAGARGAGVLPERLHVRDDALAVALRPELEARGVAVFVSELPGLDEALGATLEHMSGSVAGGATAAPWTWAETEATPGELAEFHAACAEYHRAAPWRLLSDGDGLLLTFPGEDEPWAASVMGGGSIHIGLALYSDPGDLEGMYQRGGEPSADWLAAQRGITLSVSYDPAADLPKPMRREVLSAGWEVAGPSAFPVLLGIGIPGRRITAALVARVAQACRAIVAFAAAGIPRTAWADPATGVKVDYMFSDSPADDDDDDYGLPWPRLEVSHLVGPAGPRADLQAAMDADSKALALRETGRYAGFSSWLQGQKPSRAARDRLMRTAAMWTRFLAGYGVPAESVTEYDVRLFLYQYLGRFENPSKPVGRHLTRSLARIFDFHAEHEGIEYPWAGFVLDELDELLAGADDPREVLRELGPHLAVDLLVRGLRPSAEVAGTVSGWSVVADNETGALREELQRRWLIWHDEVVRTGITDPGELRDVLLGRQRRWENTPHARWAGRTPKQVLIESCQATGGQLAESC